MVAEIREKGTLWKRPQRSLSYFYHHDFKRQRKRKKKKGKSTRPVTTSLGACELRAALLCKDFRWAESQSARSLLK